MIYWMIGGLLVAAFFIGFPLLKSRKRLADIQGEKDIEAANVALFNAQMDALKQQREREDIDEDQFLQLQRELQKQLIQDTGDPDSPEQSRKPELMSNQSRWLFVGCMLLLPLLAIGLYVKIGSSRDVQIAELMEQRLTVTSEAEDKAIRDELLRRLMQALERQPEHVAYLVTTARLLLEEEKYLLSQTYYQRAVLLVPEQPNILAEYAQASYFAAGNQLTPVVKSALQQSLALDPGNATALGLQGIGSFEAGDYRKAIDSWRGAMARMPANSQQAQALEAGIAQAEKRLAGSGSSVNGGSVNGGSVNGASVNGESANGNTVNEPSPVISNASAVVHLTLDNSLVAAKDQVVYLFAREVGGSPMPLAVARLRVGDLPATLTLDDSMAMPGGKKLSSASKIQLVARVSQSGTVMPQPGDLEGKSGNIDLAEAHRGVDLTIDTSL